MGNGTGITALRNQEKRAHIVLRSPTVALSNSPTTNISKTRFIFPQEVKSPQIDNWAVAPNKSRLGNKFG